MAFDHVESLGAEGPRDGLDTPEGEGAGVADKEPLSERGVVIRQPARGRFGRVSSKSLTVLVKMLFLGLQEQASSPSVIIDFVPAVVFENRLAPSPGHR